MAKICVVCGKEMGPFTGKTKLTDGTHVCNSCWGKAGLSTWTDLDKGFIYSSSDILWLIDEKEHHDSIIRSFVVTDDISSFAKFNDDTRQMILSDYALVDAANNPQRNRPETYTLFSYEQIVSFELLENGESIASGGLGRAALGGLLFGGAGAVIGATTRSHKAVCEELKIKITLKNYAHPTFYLPILVMETKKSSWVYKEKMKTAQDILAKLQIITSTETSKVSDTILGSDKEDKFEEIRKYKFLLDEGILTGEEFDKKKKEILGL